MCGMASVTGGEMVRNATCPCYAIGTLSSIATVLFSKKEKIVEKVGVRAGQEVVVEPRYREPLMSLNSMAYR